jgi:pimeloyl-ACP methyl ester carboxylesterase
MFSPDRQQSELFDWIPQMEIIKMPGSHHLHLEEGAERVAEEVKRFLK